MGQSFRVQLPGSISGLGSIGGMDQLSQRSQQLGGMDQLSQRSQQLGGMGAAVNNRGQLMPFNQQKVRFSNVFEENGKALQDEIEIKIRSFPKIISLAGC